MFIVNIIITIIAVDIHESAGVEEQRGALFRFVCCYVSLFYFVYFIYYFVCFFQMLRVFLSARTYVIMA